MGKSMISWGYTNCDGTSPRGGSHARARTGRRAWELRGAQGSTWQPRKRRKGSYGSARARPRHSEG